MGNRKIHILHVEDNARDSRFIQKLLGNGSSSAGDLRATESLTSALKSMKRRKTDIILLDLDLPESQGVDTYLTIRDQAPDIPIIIMSDPDNEPNAIRAFEEGAQDYLIKGQFDSHLLVKSIRYAVDRGELQSALERQTKELRESEDRLQKIIQENTNGILLLDRDGKVLFANPATEVILGKQLPGLLGKRLNLPLVFGEKKEVDIPLSKDYSRTVEIRVVEMEWEGKNALLVLLHDITEWKIVENDLKESRELSQSIIETATDAFVMMDSCGLILEWNRMAEKIFGWTRDEALYRSLIPTIFPPRHQEYHLKSITDFLTTGEGPFLSEEIELTAIHRDGHEFPVEFNIWPIQEGDSYRLSAFIRDISELKELQQLKDEYMRTVSHEMRTPLTSIREGISQIQEGLLGDTTEGQREYFTMILNDIDRLTRIINDLLDMSRFESGAVQLNIENIDMAELIRGIHVAFLPRAEEKGLGIEIDFQEKPLLIEADRDKIIQVLTNLVGNAVKFTREGRVCISISMDEERVECRVSDTGRGISRDEIPKIFDKFQQFGKSNGSHEKGTGLGLFITRAIVELHHGKIWVESQLHEGTEFHFTLPKRQKERAQPDPETGRSPGRSKQSRSAYVKKENPGRR